LIASLECDALNEAKNKLLPYKAPLLSKVDSFVDPTPVTSSVVSYKSNAVGRPSSVYLRTVIFAAIIP
jgi:hypothetical protein